MIVDTRPIVERIMVRCNDCPRQVAVFVSSSYQITDALNAIGWGVRDGLKHYCGEHDE